MVLTTGYRTSVRAKAAYWKIKEITLERWLKGRGKLNILCFSDGTARIKINLFGLIPNGIYTAWGLFSRDVTNDGVDDLLAPIPLGGVPNVIIPNNYGWGTFERRLGYCPHEQDKFQFIDITYHSDGNVFGGSVDLIRPNQPAFSVTNTHIAFPIMAHPE